MFTWYRNSQVCYAYLSGVSSMLQGEVDYISRLDFPHSKWFTRGWTLQGKPYFTFDSTTL